MIAIGPKRRVIKLKFVLKSTSEVCLRRKKKKKWWNKEINQHFLGILWKSQWQWKLFVRRRWENFPVTQCETSRIQRSFTSFCCFYTIFFPLKIEFLVVRIMNFQLEFASSVPKWESSRISFTWDECFIPTNKYYQDSQLVHLLESETFPFSSKSTASVDRWCVMPKGFMNANFSLWGKSKEGSFCYWKSRFT